MAIPAITAQIVNVLYNVVDRIYIGHIPKTGQLSLTGLGVCMPLIMLVSAFAALAGMGGAPRASIMLGKGAKEEAEKILGNCASLLFFVAVTLTLLMLFFAEPFLMKFGASENTIGYAMDYMQIYMFGTVFVQMSLGLNAFITALGFAKVSMKTTLIGAITNIILDPVFIFFFGMGVKGAALATVLSQMLSAAWVLHFLTGKKTILKLQKKNLRLEAKTILPCVLLGLSPFVMQFSILPLSGLCQGAQPITGYNFGAGKGERVRESFGILLKSSVIYTTALWLIVMIFPRQVAMLFAGDGAFLDYTVWALRIYMALSLLMGVQLACQQTFIAIGNAKTSLFLAIYRKIILLIPLIYILPRFFEKKDMAVFLAEPVADFVAVTTTAILFARQFKRAMKELEN
ncbi:MAG: MATE family efflux transporter [Anaerotignum sp.]|nr:MATE family efflux transporter [Anaerotignum sp.]